jgi:hypothetical protein
MSAKTVNTHACEYVLRGVRSCTLAETLSHSLSVTWRLHCTCPLFRTLRLAKFLHTSKMSSGTTSEETFEWIETPPARSPTKPAFDSGVRTTSVSKLNRVPLEGAPRAIELHHGGLRG